MNETKTRLYLIIWIIVPCLQSQKKINFLHEAILHNHVKGMKGMPVAKEAILRSLNIYNM